MSKQMHGPPIIDIAPLLARQPDGDSRPIVTTIHNACLESGFFVAVGHQLDGEMAGLFRQARQFFELRQIEKEKTPRINRYGFVPHHHHAIDGDRRTGATEYLDLGLADEVPMPDLPGFEQQVRTYQTAALSVGTAILWALAVALGTDPAFFTSRMHNPQCRLRLLHYLQAEPGPDGALPVPTESHTDYGAITLLATDGVPGLEVKPLNGTWTQVEAPAGSLVVNLGDMLARWTNDTYQSTPHRVVGPAHTDRFSIPFFINPDSSTVVESTPESVSIERPARYLPITAGEFLASRIDNAALGGAEPYVDRKDGPIRTLES